MPTNVSVALRKALTLLESEKARIDGQIAAIRGVLTGARPGAGATRRARRRKPMSAAAKRAVSIRMKAYWAKRRAAKGK